MKYASRSFCICTSPSDYFLITKGRLYMPVYFSFSFSFAEVLILFSYILSTYATRWFIVILIMNLVMWDINLKSAFISTWFLRQCYGDRSFEAFLYFAAIVLSLIWTYETQNSIRRSVSLFQFDLILLHSLSWPLLILILSFTNFIYCIFISLICHRRILRYSHSICEVPFLFPWFPRFRFYTSCRRVRYLLFYAFFMNVRFICVLQFFGLCVFLLSLVIHFSIGMLYFDVISDGSLKTIEC